VPVGLIPPQSGPDKGRAPTLPRAIWALGFVSMLMDISSEMVHNLLPLFLVSALGVSVAVVGLIEGIAQSTALIVQVCSGVLSDHFRLVKKERHRSFGKVLIGETWELLF